MIIMYYWRIQNQTAVWWLSVFRTIFKKQVRTGRNSRQPLGPLSLIQLTLVHPRGVVANCSYLFKAALCFILFCFVFSINFAKRFNVTVFRSFTHLLVYLMWNLRVLFEYGGSSKIMVERGSVKSHNFYFVHFIIILQDICSKLAMWMRIIISLHNQQKKKKKSLKNPIFLRFLAKNRFLLIFRYIFNTSKFVRAGWLYDVIVTSYEVK